MILCKDLCWASVALALAMFFVPLRGAGTETNLFVSGTDGYHTYRIPALLTTPDGTVLAFCEGRKQSGSDRGEIHLLLKRSSDGGQTWSDQQVVWSDGLNTCGNPCPVLDERTGTIWLLATHNLGVDTEKDIIHKRGKSTRTVWVMSSEDKGATWSKPKEITSSVKDSSWGWYATGPGIGIQIRHGQHKGRLVIPCDHSYDDPKGTVAGGPFAYGSHVIYSDDSGATWALGGVIRPNVNECQVVELADNAGTLLMDMRSYFGRNRRTHSISRDGGETWTEPKDHPQLIEPVCQASILRCAWPKDGASVIAFANPASTKREKMTVRLSYDEGRTWPVANEIYAGPAAYSSLALLPDGTLGLLYERGQRGPYETITFVSIPILSQPGSDQEP